MGRGQRGLGGRLGRCLAAMLVVLVAWPLAAQTASAEELLVTSDPYRHQQLSDPPSGVVLAFSREVDAAAAQIVVTNSAGQSVNINSLIVEGTNVTAQVKPNLPKDTYTVHYQVNRKDGQVEGGAFQFSYGKGHWTKLPDEHWSGNTAQPTVIASAQPEPATATATDTASPAPSDTASGGVSVSPASPDATPVPASGGDGGAGPWPWVIGAVVVVAAAAGGYAWYRRGAGKSGGATGA